MFFPDVKKLRHILVSLRFSILSIFVTLFVIAMSLLITINYFHSAKNILFTAKNLMHETSLALSREFSSEISTAERDNRFSAELIEGNVLSVKSPAELVTYTLDLATHFNIVQAAFWGDEKGNFTIAKYAADDTITSEIMDRDKSPATHEIIYRNKKGQVIKRESSSDFSYDPRTRPWYTHAKEMKTTSWTDIYPYHPDPYLGISVATPVYKNKKLIGVFGLDVRLDWLSWYIGEQNISQNGVIHVLTTDGTLLAHPRLPPINHQKNLIDIHDFSEPQLAAAYDIYKKTGKEEFDFVFKGKEYLAVYSVLPHFAMHGWVIGIVVPASDFTGDLKETSLLNLEISLIILILGIVFVSGLVTRVVSPIKKLVIETARIKNFDLESKVRIESRIKEVMALSDSIQAMKTGLRAFQRYVPATLVRELIEHDEHAQIGGSKKTLTIFFSDIEDFTTIAEQMDPNMLMSHMCEYFDELSHIIMEEKGTIDKYIGDSIMAFWGAPARVEVPSRHAALAALACKKRLVHLNKKWRSEGKAALVTRIGLHKGDVVVGNVGSSERINYTAVGDSINMASRLEGLNKVYHTSIMISEEVYRVIENEFVCRKVDRVVIKGKAANYNIYELLSQTKSELSFDIDLYRDTFDKAFSAYEHGEWDAALHQFEKCTKIFPEDTVVAVFILRCYYLKEHPQADWNGVWRVTSG